MPTKKIYQDYDFQKVGKILGALLDPRASDVTSPGIGQAWYDTSSNRLKTYSGLASQTLLTKEGNDTITGLYAFSPTTGNVPFTVGLSLSGTVVGLNSDLVDGFHASQSATADTVAVRQADGNLWVTTPTTDNAAANKAYVDAAVNNLDDKTECRVASTGNLNLSSMPATVDGVTLSSGDRFLAKNQTDASKNGIYVFNGAGSAATRASDADENSEVTAGMTTYILAGSTHLGGIFKLVTPNPITVGTTDLTFTQTGGQSLYTAGNGLVKENSVFHFIQSGAYTPGNIVYATSGSEMGFLSNGAAGTVLKGGATPSWAALDLTADVGTSVLGISNGGTGTNTQFTQGAVVIAGASGVYTQDVAGIFFDATTNRLGLGTQSPGYTADIVGTLSVAGSSRLGTADTHTVNVNGNMTLGPFSSTPAVLGTYGTFHAVGRSGSSTVPVVRFNKETESGTIAQFQNNGVTYAELGSAENHFFNNVIVGGGTLPSTNYMGVFRKQVGSASLLVGSVNGAGASLLLDGASNGDGLGGDYASITHGNDGILKLQNSYSDGSIDLVADGTNVARFNSNGNVSLGRHSGTWSLDVYTNTQTAMFRLVANLSGTSGPVQRFEHDTPSPALNDIVGTLAFHGRSSDDSDSPLANVRVQAKSIGTNYVDGDILATVYRAGTAYDVLTITHDERVGINTNSPSTALEISGDVRLSGRLDLSDRWKQKVISLPQPVADAGPGKWYIRLHANSVNNTCSLRLRVCGHWSYGASFGFLEGDYAFYCNGTSLDTTKNYFRVISANGFGVSAIRIGAIEEENGYISIPVWAANTNTLYAHLEYQESISGNLDGVTVSAWTSEAMPSYTRPNPHGFDASHRCQIELSESTNYSGAAPAIADSFLTLSNHRTTGAANMQSTLRFQLYDDTYERFGAFSMVSESVSNLKTAFVWCPHNGTSATEAMRLTAAGRLGLGTNSPVGKLHTYGGSAGTYTLASSYDTLVLESAGTTGISIVSPDAEPAGIRWNSPSSGNLGFAGLRADGFTDGSLVLYTNQASGKVQIATGTNTTAATFTNDGKLGVGVTAPLGTGHFRSGSSGNVAGVSANYDELVIEGSGNTGIAILTQNNSNGAIGWFNEDDADLKGGLVYSHANDWFDFYVEGNRAMRLDSANRLGVNTGTDGLSYGFEARGTSFTQVAARNISTTGAAGVSAVNDDTSGWVKLETAGSTSAIGALTPGNSIVMAMNNLALGTNSVRTPVIQMTTDRKIGFLVSDPDTDFEFDGNMRIHGDHGLGVGNEVGPSVILYPGGGGYSGSGNPGETGYIKIQLPQTWTNTMLTFEVHMYEYNTGMSHVFHMGGYNLGSSSSWTQTFAWVSGDNDSSYFQVHFGHDGSKCAVYIEHNDDGSSGNWGNLGPHIVVRNVHAGFNGNSYANWKDGWDVSITATLGTITSLQICDPKPVVGGDAGYLPKLGTNKTQLENSLLFQDGSSGIGLGTTSVSLGDNADSRIESVAPLLDVKATGTSGSHTCVARFEAGPDADDSGVAIRLNHVNDRGLQMLAGRGTGDTSFIAFSALTAGGAARDFLTVNNGAPTLKAPVSSQYVTISPNSGNSLYVADGGVGIGVSTPGAKLHVIGTAYITGNFTLPNIAATALGTPNVVVANSGVLETKTPDSRIWGTSLVGGSGAVNKMAYWTTANTVDDSGLAYDHSNLALGIGPASPSYRLEIAASTAFSGTGTMHLNCSLNGSGSGLSITANTRTASDDAVALLGITNRTGQTAFQVNVAGTITLGQLTASKLLGLDGSNQITTALDSDALTEGSSNLYFTNARAQAAISSASSAEISYSSGTIGLGTEAARVKSGTIGNGSDTTLTFTHNFNTRAVFVQVIQTNSPYEEVDVQPPRTTLNSVTIETNIAPGTNEWTIICMAANG